MHKNLILFALVSGLLACGEKRDELTPYIQTLQGLESHSQQLMRYQKYLTTEGMTSQAHDVEQVMQNLLDELEKVELEDKRLRALHNAMKRAIKAAMRKLVEPDFPTFVPNAQKSIGRLEDEFTKIYGNLELMWQRAGKTEPFPLKWEAVE
ncbi:MAG: hypothetical protein F4Z57_12815 [Gemmatimonadetes bacterium]|nr:hypothetical protein [Gemmatimonadota bacterium]MYC70589.1 hypothetical protein [Gemmatimonadota bacterium]